MAGRVQAIGRSVQVWLVATGQTPEARRHQERPNGIETLETEVFGGKDILF